MKELPLKERTLLQLLAGQPSRVRALERHYVADEPPLQNGCAPFVLFSQQQ